MANAKLTIPLDLPDVEILHVRRTRRGKLIITVESTLKSTICRKCGLKISGGYDHGREITLRHLPILGQEVYIKYRPKRFRCPHCSGKPVTTQKVEWHEARSPHTKAYDDHILCQLVNATVKDVSIREKLNYDAVLGVLERRISAEVDWSQYQVLGVLGLDEIALKKGHRDFVTIVSARLMNNRVVILAVLPDREKQTVKAFLETMPTRLQKTIHTVCSDMYEGFINAAYEVLPHVRVVVDRFHVAKNYRDAADRLRKQTLKRLKEELSEEEYAELKGHMWPFRKRPADLSPDEQVILDRLFSYAPELRLAYNFREELTDIFNQPLTKADAQQQIKDWISRVRQSGLKCFNKFLNTLEKWWAEITNYFTNRLNSGFVEGFNNKLKVIKRRCYGILNIQHFFQRIFLDLEGYRLFA